MKKKINKEESIVYSQWSDPVTLGTKGTLVKDFDKPESYYEGTVCGIRQMLENPFMNKNGFWYKYFVPESGRVLEDEYKPFTNTEQLKKAGLFIGDSFFVRSKGNPEFTHLVTVTEISINSEGSIVSIGLGTSVFPSKELLENYEWSNKLPKDNDWRSFEILLEIRK